MPPQQYPVAAIAQLLKLTERRVQQLVKDSILPRPARGVYDPIACVHSYIDYLKRLLAGSGELSLTEERTRLTKTQADMAELLFRKSSGDLIQSKKASQVWGEIVTTIRQRLLGLSTRLAPQVATSQSIPEIKERIDAAIHEVLSELSSPDLHHIGRAESSPESPGGLPPPAALYHQPVGRRKAKAKPRKQRRARAVEHQPGRVPKGDDGCVQ